MMTLFFKRSTLLLGVTFLLTIYGGGCSPSKSHLEATGEASPAAEQPSEAVQPPDTLARTDAEPLQANASGDESQPVSRALPYNETHGIEEDMEDVDESCAPEPVTALDDGTAPIPATEREAPLDALEAESAPSADKSIKSSESKTYQPKLDEALDFCQAAQDFWQKGDLDNALEALDQAYSLILDISPADTPEILQQKEDLRFLISKRILEIYASRHVVVNGDHDAIPIDLNRHVQAEIKLFTTGVERKFFRASLERSGRYRPYILAALEEAGLPAELSWVPLIESGFKVKALSRARALGLWQFIPSTGYKFGLKRNQLIDERIDPVRATEAAIKYLKELHSLFGDWSTVLAAYNCGEGRVLRVIRTQNVKYLDNFWDLYERLPRETARYVPRFLATLHIINNLEQYGLDKVCLYPPLEYDTVKITKQVHLKHIAKQIGVSEQHLAELNPELRYKITPPESFRLKVPVGKHDLLLAKLDQIPVSKPPQRAYVWHRVRSGETLGTIARRYRTTVGRIMRANNLRSSHFIRAGRKLKIPVRGTSTKRRTTVAYKPELYGPAKTHVVKSGDSLWILAQRYGTTVEAIKGINNLYSTRLRIGQKLTIPERKKGTLSASSGSKTHLVRRGDSPYTIARQYQLPLGRFLRMNNLTPRSRIYPGQELLVE
jgi:membrane-bound lytic murein transglycosylase D